MKFNKFVLFMIIGVFIFNSSSIKAYAAEDVSVNQKQGNVIEQSSVEKSPIEQSSVEKSPIEQSSVEQSIVEQSTIEQNTVEQNTVEKSPEKEGSNDNTKTNQIVEAKTVKYTKAELRLLSALIYCEAQGESYNGKLAVGIVVMNRVRSDRYPKTLKGVIYQKYQFSPVTSGALKKALSEYDKGKFTSSTEKECIKAAKAALNGSKKITVKGVKKSFSKYLFFSGRLRGYTYQLENHQFK